MRISREGVGPRGVSRGRAPRSTIGKYGERIMNARYLCTPPSTMETFGEEISAGKEIAGLLRT